ncbi:hypothetical protein CEXT_134391 [Caerostris extrusa]|uniref:Uncharacterized protein n=1 Tax=Caerostris extrusa TaxID=172846 RepID=A0AAV4X604_CAEEX|nr:hypothetical protein CEXT_134391 [Caerostris extrusa]
MRAVDLVLVEFLVRAEYVSKTYSSIKSINCHQQEYTKIIEDIFHKVSLSAAFKVLEYSPFKSDREMSLISTQRSRKLSYTNALAGVLNNLWSPILSGYSSQPVVRTTGQDITGN